MKKIILCLVIITCISSCSNTDENSTEAETPISFNKLKAYNKNIAYYSYNVDPTRNGIYRIYLDTISNIITQYTSHRETNQSDTSESFGIKSTIYYPNYKKTNIDYMSYEVTAGGNTTGSIIFSHKTNTDTFLFKKLSPGTPIIFSDTQTDSEIYKKMY